MIKLSKLLNIDQSMNDSNESQFSDFSLYNLDYNIASDLDIEDYDTKEIIQNNDLFNNTFESILKLTYNTNLIRCGIHTFNLCINESYEIRNLVKISYRIP